MIYRSSLSFVKLHWFWAKLRALDLVNFSDQTVFRTFFLRASRYWPDFWHVSQSPWFTDQVWVSLPSIDFLAKLQALDLVQFSDRTVFRTFFLNAWRYWPVFWHGSQSTCFTDQLRVSLCSIDFWWSYWPWNLVNCSDQTVFRTFFSKRLQILTWFLAWSSITMFYRLSLSFVTLNWFLVKLLALKLSKFQRSNSFPDFFPKSLQMLTSFWACKSITMTYR